MTGSDEFVTSVVVWDADAHYLDKQRLDNLLWPKICSVLREKIGPSSADGRCIYTVEFTLKKDRVYDASGMGGWRYCAGVNIGRVQFHSPIFPAGQTPATLHGVDEMLLDTAVRKWRNIKYRVQKFVQEWEARKRER